MTGIHGSPAVRLARRLVVKDSGCIEWTGPKKRGYGLIGVDKKTVNTHRLAWELANGPIPDGLHVLHHCDNPPCCQTKPTPGYPDGHLFLGTPAQNAADMIAKGRNHQQKKTHCPQGHPYDEANTYIAPNGGRHCRICGREACSRWGATLGRGPKSAARTHCPAGHEYDLANTYVHRDGSRHCRACRAAGGRAARRKAAA